MSRRNKSGHTRGLGSASQRKRRARQEMREQDRFDAETERMISNLEKAAAQAKHQLDANKRRLG